MTGWVDAVAVLVWNCFAWVIWGAAIFEVLRAPAADFERGWRTKIVRLAVILTLGGSVGGLYLPLGAAVVLFGLRRTRRRSRSNGPGPSPGPQLPWCDGGYLPPPR